MKFQSILPELSSVNSRFGSTLPPALEASGTLELSVCPAKAGCHVIDVTTAQARSRFRSELVVFFMVLSLRFLSLYCRSVVCTMVDELRGPTARAVMR